MGRGEGKKPKRNESIQTKMKSEVDTEVREFRLKKVWGGKHFRILKEPSEEIASLSSGIFTELIKSGNK